MPHSAVAPSTAPPPGVPPPTLAAQSLPLLLARVAARLSRSAAQFYNEHWGIGTTEYRLLLGLGLTGRCNALQLSVVADVDPGAASRSLRQLARDDWVSLARHGREVMVHLTASGAERLVALRQAALAREQAQLQGLDETARQQLRLLLETLLHNAARLEADARPAPHSPSQPPC